MGRRASRGLGSDCDTPFAAHPVRRRGHRRPRAGAHRAQRTRRPAVGASPAGPPRPAPTSATSGPFRPSRAPCSSCSASPIRVGAPPRLRRDAAPRCFFAAGIAVLLLSVAPPSAAMAQQGLSVGAHAATHPRSAAWPPLLLLWAFPPAAAPKFLSAAAVRAHPAHPVPAGGVRHLDPHHRGMALPEVHHQVLINPWCGWCSSSRSSPWASSLWLPVVERSGGTGMVRHGWEGHLMTGVWDRGLRHREPLWFSGTGFYESHAYAAQIWGFKPLEDQAKRGHG